MTFTPQERKLKAIFLWPVPISTYHDLVPGDSFCVGGSHITVPHPTPPPPPPPPPQGARGRQECGCCSVRTWQIQVQIPIPTAVYGIPLSGGPQLSFGGTTFYGTLRERACFAFARDLLHIYLCWCHTRGGSSLALKWRLLTEDTRRAWIYKHGKSLSIQDVCVCVCVCLHWNRATNVIPIQKKTTTLFSMPSMLFWSGASVRPMSCVCEGYQR